MEEIVKLVRKPMKTEQEMKMVEVVVLEFHDEKMVANVAKEIITKAKYPYKLTVYNNEQNTANLSKIWNKLAEESMCDYICFCDPDLTMPVGWLAKMMDVFDNYPNAVLVVPGVDNTSGSQQKKRGTGVERLNTIMGGQCMLFKREFLEREPFDEDFLLYGQDSEMGNRIIKKGYEAYVRKDVYMNHIGEYSNKKAAKEGNLNFDPGLERVYATTLYERKK